MLHSNTIFLIRVGAYDDVVNIADTRFPMKETSFTSFVSTFKTGRALSTSPIFFITFSMGVRTLHVRLLTAEAVSFPLSPPGEIALVDSRIL